MHTALLAILMLALPFSPNPSSHTYTYFGETKTLDIDYSIIAVFNKDGTPLVPYFVSNEHSEFSESSVNGFAYIKTPSQIKTYKQLDDLIHQLHDTSDYDFISPIFFGEGGLPYIPTQTLLVKSEEMQNQLNVQQVLSKHGKILDTNFAGIPNLYRVLTQLQDGRDVLRLANTLAKMNLFEYAESDSIAWVNRMHIPNDPEFNTQWGLNQTNDHDMDVPEAWDISFGNEEIVVVVLDSGIDQTHPDIHQLPGETFTGASNNGAPSNICDNHGTAVGGCVAATIDNDLGVAGVAPHCYVRAGKVFNEMSLFDLICLPFLEFQESWVVEGITWAADSGARITNSSWGGGTPSSSISEAFNITREQGVLHVAAAGNDGTSTIGWPANLSSVISVSALASNGTLASFSTYGNGLFISAPGQSIRTTDRSGSDGYGSGDTTTIDGTSFSSPYVAGVAALILSVDSNLTPIEVEDVLASTAVDYGTSGYDTTFGHGFVNAGAALASLDTPGCEGDVNNDNNVNVSDLLEIINQWLTSNADADVNNDGIVNVSDLLLTISNWGDCS